MEAGRRDAGGPRWLRPELAAIWLEADGPARRRRSQPAGSQEEGEVSWELCVWDEGGYGQGSLLLTIQAPDVTSNSRAARLGHLSQGATFSMRIMMNRSCLRSVSTCINCTRVESSPGEMPPLSAPGSGLWALVGESGVKPVLLRYLPFQPVIGIA